MAIYVFIIAIILVAIMNIIGRLWVRNWIKYKYSFSLSTCMGLVTVFAMFQFIAVPAIHLHMKLSTLTIITVILILLLLVLSYRVNGAELFEYFKAQIEKLQYLRFGKARGWCYIVIVLVLAQTLIAAFTYTGHEDDNRYIAAILDAYDTDVMLMHNPITGEYMGDIRSELIKDSLAPIIMFWGVWCKLFRIHPATFTHIAVPLFMIPICYGLYYVIARELMKQSTRRASMFVIVFWLFNLFNQYTPREGIGRMIYYMRWGKSILCAFLIPLLFLLLMELIEDTQIKYIYNLIMLVTYGGCLASVMTAIFIPYVIGLYAVCDGIRKKSFKRFWRLLICSIPALIYGIIYFMMS